MNTIEGTRSEVTKVLFRSIAKKLRHDIRDGVYKVGERLPSEHLLCEKFDTSRHTIRAALNCLQEEGLIKRRQGAGTVVIASESDGLFHNSISSLNELVQFAESTELEILGIETVFPSGIRAKIIGINIDKPWIRVLALRREPHENSAIGYIEIYIPHKFKDIVDDIGKRKTAIYEILEDRFGIEVKEVNQVIEAQFADADIASRLNVEKGEALLLISRHYYDSDGNLVEVTLNAHPRNRFKYEMTLTRSQNGF